MFLRRPFATRQIYDIYHITLICKILNVLASAFCNTPHIMHLFTRKHRFHRFVKYETLGIQNPWFLEPTIPTKRRGAGAIFPRMQMHRAADATRDADVTAHGMQLGKGCGCNWARYADASVQPCKGYADARPTILHVSYLSQGPTDGS